MNDYKFIVLSADALVTEDLKLLETMPNYSKYIMGGSGTKSMLSVCPSVTYVAHTAMASGCMPGKTGVVSNFATLEHGVKNRPWCLTHDFVKVPDIFTAAKRAGKTTAAVFWPVTGNHPDIDMLINEIPGCTPDMPIDEALKDQGSNEEMLEIARMYAGEMVRTGVHPGCDYFVADCAAEIIRRHAPDLILVHPANVDGTRHCYGVFNEQVNTAVKETDDMLGILARAAEASGYKDKYNIILVSDHGQMDMNRIVNVDVLFAENGWVNKETGEAEVYSVSQGFSFYVFLKDKNDEVLKAKVEKVLKDASEDGIFGFGEVLTAEQAKERYGLYGDFSFVVDTDGETGFGEEITRPALVRFRDPTDYRKGSGCHGHFPERGPQPVFMAKGPAFKENVICDAGHIADLAPTLAKAMDIEFYPCDGKALTDIIK